MRPRLFISPYFALALVAGAVSQELINDKEKLQGNWKVVNHQEDGRDPPADFKVLHIVVAGDRLTMKFKNGDDREERRTFNLDPNKKPKWIDLKVRNVSFSGIYELEGDTLRICFNERGGSKERATEFITKPGSPASILLICKREKRE